MAAVPIYDSLGEAAVEYIVNHSGGYSTAGAEGWEESAGGRERAGGRGLGGALCVGCGCRACVPLHTLCPPVLPLPSCSCRAPCPPAEMCLALVDTANLAKWAKAVPATKAHVHTGARGVAGRGGEGGGEPAAAAGGHATRADR